MRLILREPALPRCDLGRGLHRLPLFSSLRQVIQDHLLAAGFVPGACSVRFVRLMRRGDVFYPPYGNRVTA